MPAQPVYGADVELMGDGDPEVSWRFRRKNHAPAVLLLVAVGTVTLAWTMMGRPTPVGPKRGVTRVWGPGKTLFRYQWFLHSLLAHREVLSEWFVAGCVPTPA